MRAASGLFPCRKAHANTGAAYDCPSNFWRNAPRIRSVNKLDAVLDTSAIICLLEDEPGADLVEQKIASAEAGHIKLGASFVSLTEPFYITHLSQGKAPAEEFVMAKNSSPTLETR
jgi:hypothetical protein